MSALAFVSLDKVGFKAAGDRIVAGLAATATLRSGGSTRWPASSADFLDEGQSALYVHRRPHARITSTSLPIT